MSDSDAAFYSGSLSTVLLDFDCIDPTPCDGLLPPLTETVDGYRMQFAGAFSSPTRIDGKLEMGLGRSPGLPGHRFFPMRFVRSD